MASGSAKYSFDGEGYDLRIEWNSVQNGQNSSWLSVYLYLDCNYRLHYWSMKYGTIVINGQSFNVGLNPEFDGTGTIKLFAQAMNVGHDNDGNKQVIITSVFNINCTLDGEFYGSIPCNCVCTLDSLTKTAPAVPEWGPNVSTKIADPGKYITVTWGGSYAGSSGNEPAPYSHCELQWNWYINGQWGSWNDVWNGAGNSANVAMPNISRGSLIQFRARIFNAYDLCSGWVYSDYVQCTVLPLPPSWIAGWPGHFEPGNTVIWSWGGAVGGSYQIKEYQIQYSTDGGSTWHDWTSNFGGTTLESSNLFAGRGEEVRIRVNMTNTGGYTTPWSTSGIIYCNLAPTAPTVVTAPNTVYLSSPEIYLSCSGGSAGEGTITEYNFGVMDTADGNWINVYSGPNPNCCVNLKDFITLTPEHTLQIRVNLKNSYNVYSPFASPQNSIKVLGGIVYVKVNGEWQTGIVHINDGGVWKQASSVLINKSATWRQGI